LNCIVFSCLPIDVLVNLFANLNTITVPRACGSLVKLNEIKVLSLWVVESLLWNEVKIEVLELENVVSLIDYQYHTNYFFFQAQLQYMLKSCLVSNHDFFLMLLMCTFSNNKSLGNSLSKYYLIYMNINMIIHFFIKLLCVYLKKIGEPCMQRMFFEIFYKIFFPLFTCQFQPHEIYIYT
jgi:hypothetical protein